MRGTTKGDTHAHRPQEEATPVPQRGNNRGGGVQKLIIPSKHKSFALTFIQSWTNVEDFKPALYKCYDNVLCLLGSRRQCSNG